MTFGAVCGDCSPQSSSTIRSVETVSFALTISRARRARCLPPASVYRLIPVAHIQGSEDPKLHCRRNDGNTTSQTA